MSAGPGANSEVPRVGSLPAALAAAFEAGGEMGRRLRDMDWSASPIGHPASWPASLANAVSMMLASKAQIVMFWGDEQLAFYNDAYRPTIGAKHPQALAQPARRHWAELWDVLGPLLAGVRESGQAFSGTDHPFVLDRYGFLEETYFDVSYDPIRIEDGSVGGIFCIVTETTGRVINERRLRALADLGAGLTGLTGDRELAQQAAEVFARHTADVPFALVYLTDAMSDGDVLAASGNVRPDQLLIAPGAARPASLAGVLAGGAPVSAPGTDYLTEVPDGAAADVLVLPLTAATEPAGALVVGVSTRLVLTDDYRTFFDLTAAQISNALATQRAYEQERARSAELAALDQAKTNFFANVSHEFRTPLTLILGPLEDALGDPDLPGRFEQPLVVMHRNSLRLLKLVNTVLDFSRLETGRLRAFYQPTDLADYTAGLASTFRSATERAGLDLVVECPPLPAPVFVDRDMWEKIVLNLLSNALKFTFDGEITVRVRAVDGAAQLEVADTGVGIDTEDLPKIFDRFHRVNGTRSRTHEGTGIGLALVRELAELHGGTAAVRSEVGRGSVFAVTVPLGAGHLPADRVAPGEVSATRSDATWLYLEETARWGYDEPAGAYPPVAVDAPRQSGGRVLVADDNADLREHVTRLLAPHWEVVTAPDGLAAFEAAVRSPFDLVLTDVMMPRLDGVGLVKRLRAEPATRHVPIVVLSARAGAGDAVQGLAAGADDYLVKPFSGQELVARVRSNVELGQLRGQIIARLRALADAAVAINTARTTTEVLRAAAQHALILMDAGRAVASVPGGRYEADGGGRSPEDESMAVALAGVAGEPLGELRVWPLEDGSSEAEQAALAQLGRLVGVRLENARLYEAEHRIATTLQHSLLPESLPQLPGAILASRYLPGTADVEVGGDWYDAIAVPDGGLALVIGDVVGKGVPAAAVMGQLRNALRAYLLEGYDPGEALTRLNRLVASAGRRSFATVSCLIFDPPSGRLRFASAGHPAPLTVTADGEVNHLFDRALGPPVGALPSAGYETRETRLAPGTRLLLYTDGLIEDRRQGIDVGIAQLQEAAAVPADHVEDLVTSLLAPVVLRSRRDDVAVLALEAAEPNHFALRLPADPTRLSVLRRRLEDFLVAHQVTDTDLFDVTVAVSEAAANAIEHPRQPREPFITVDISITDAVVVATVRDTGQWREPTEAGFRGRGLALIEALAELTVVHTNVGTTVTLRRRLHRPD